MPEIMRLQSAFDAIELLGPRSSDRLRQLRLKVNDAHSLIPPFTDLQEANAAKYDAERQFKRLLAPRAEGGFSLHMTDARVVEAEKHFEKMTDAARRLTELTEVRSQAWRSVCVPKTQTRT